MRARGFEVISSFEHAGISLPLRKTSRSAGYDLASAIETTLPPGDMTVIPTGLKAYMNDDEFLGIHLRSSLAIKHHLMLANSEGIIDADYYNNEENEGHIFIGIWNRGPEPFEVKKGMRIAQAIFAKFLTTDRDELSEKKERRGGIGSTGL